MGGGALLLEATFREARLAATFAVLLKALLAAVLLAASLMETLLFAFLEVGFDAAFLPLELFIVLRRSGSDFLLSVPVMSAF